MSFVNFRYLRTILLATGLLLVSNQVVYGKNPMRGLKNFFTKKQEVNRFEHFTYKMVAVGSGVIILIEVFFGPIVIPRYVEFTTSHQEKLTIDMIEAAKTPRLGQALSIDKDTVVAFPLHKAYRIDAPFAMDDDGVVTMLESDVIQSATLQWLQEIIPAAAEGGDFDAAVVEGMSLSELLLDTGYRLIKVGKQYYLVSNNDILP